MTSHRIATRDEADLAKARRGWELNQRIKAAIKPCLAVYAASIAILVVMKLVGAVSFSWPWILAPVWIPGVSLLVMVGAAPPLVIIAMTLSDRLDVDRSATEREEWTASDRRSLIFALSGLAAAAALSLGVTAFLVSYLLL